MLLSHCSRFLRLVFLTVRHIILSIFLIAIVGVTNLRAQGVNTQIQRIKCRTILTLSNAQVECSVIIDSTKLTSDRLISQVEWAKGYGGMPSVVETDADFAAEIMWTDWQAPGKVNNGENPIMLTKNAFQFDRQEFVAHDSGSQELTLYLHGKDVPLLARVVYRLDPNSFYVRRKIALSDTNDGGHFLQWIWARAGTLAGKPTILKDGGFGQPIAFQNKNNGGFFGL